jgi:hypothetical protein
MNQKSTIYARRRGDRSSPQFHISTRLDDLCNEGQRHMSEGDDRASSGFDMLTRIDDICNEEQRIYVTTVDVMLFSFTCLSSMKVGLIWTKIPKNIKNRRPGS